MANLFSLNKAYEEIAPRKHNDTLGHELAEFFWNTCSSLGLAVSDDGKILDKETQKQVRENHLRCMLRMAYIEAGRTEFKGKTLNNLIDLFLKSLRSLAKEFTENGKKYGLEVEQQMFVSDEYV